MQTQSTPTSPQPTTPIPLEDLTLTPDLARATLATLEELKGHAGLSSEQCALSVVCRHALGLPQRGCTYEVHRTLSRWNLSHLVSPLLSAGRGGRAQQVALSLGFSSDKERYAFAKKHLGRTVETFKAITEWEGGYLQALRERGVSA